MILGRSNWIWLSMVTVAVVGLTALCAITGHVILGIFLIIILAYYLMWAFFRSY